jgi:predicted nucleic acid-binding protein
MVDALFDTTVFIDYQQGKPGATRLTADLFEGRITVAYSAVSVFELWARPPGRQLETGLRSILSMCQELPLTSAMARRAADILAGRSIHRAESLFRDALIAATAIDAALPIYTRNVTDFQQLGANVYTY